MDTLGNYGRVDDALLDQLAAIVGGNRLSTAEGVLEQHGRDESYHEGHPPQAVVYPRTAEEVSAIVKACSARHVPVIPFGAGTSLEGHVAALAGGVTLDMSEMNEIVAVNAEDLDVVVQPGVTRKQLNSYLRDTGLFFPVDPGADASIGGMVATRASGTNAVRYGTIRENVLSLQVVLADGRIIRTGTRARKSAAGYDLTHLFVGSEGTLGVVTEVTLRLYGVPEAISAAVCAFPSVKDAVDTVIETIQSGVPVARIELLDTASMAAMNEYAKFDYPESPHLFFEFHGTENGVAEQSEMVKELAVEHGGGDFQWATRQEDRDRLWNARHNAYYAARTKHPGTSGVVGDACVPISRLAEAIAQTEEILAQTDLPTYIVGHVGDGNFHTLFLVRPGNADELAEAKRLNDRIVEKALSLGGTCTGEHGVGSGKMEFLKDEHGEGVEVMAAIKRALDPDNLMNPGKMVAV